MAHHFSCDVRYPAIGFPIDGGAIVMPDALSLVACTMLLVARDRHIGMEVVDSAEHRWVVTGFYKPESVKRRWWQFRPSMADEEKVDMEEIEPSPFEATVQRLRGQALPWFAEGDASLVAIRAATTLLDLCRAWGDIEWRKNAHRILADDPAVTTKTATEVARRAIVLFAMHGAASGGPRSNILSWLDEQGLLDALSPTESYLLTERRPSEEMLIELGWNAEALIAVLWSMGLLDTMPTDRDWDGSLLAERIPPTNDRSVNDFVAAARLRPLTDIARMTETLWHQLVKAREALEADESSERRIAHETAWHRLAAVHWMLDANEAWA